MRSLALIMAPIVGALCLTMRGGRARAADVLVLTAIVAATLALAEAFAPSEVPGPLQQWLRCDVTCRLFLAVIDPVYLGVSVYVWSRQATTPALRAGMPRFVGLALAFLAAANVALVASHILVVWLALETTTFAAAGLIVREGVRPTYHASFRYVLFSSVGLGLAVLGLTCLARGAELSGREASFFIDGLPGLTAGGSTPWGALGLSLTLLGLGTKLGLAPMYSWLPEVYDEAPPAVAALLGAVQFNCALVMLFRVVHACRPHYASLVATQLVTMGIVSMAVSAVGVITTRNMKRLVAYASINHAGVIAIGLGLGKGASFGLLLYVLSNAFVKAVLFLTAGKIKAHYHTKDTRLISGLIKQLPYSGVFLMVGTFALLGFPPFGSFVGELLVISALVSSGRTVVFATFCLLLAMTFVATGRTIFPMIWGEPKKAHVWPRQTLLGASPKLAFLLCLVVLGVYVPPQVNGLIQQVAASLEAP